MIPFIIGGVALAATGYGIAKLLEDECQYFGHETKSEDSNESKKAYSNPFYKIFNDGNDEPLEDECFERFNRAKIELHNSSFLELTTALNEIRNLPETLHIANCLDFAVSVYPFDTISEELKSNFEKHTKILQDTKKYIDSHLDTLDTIIISDINYENYSDEDKKLIYHLVQICKLIENATQSQITYDKVEISREVKRAFAKLETIIFE